ncbi:thiosulfate sulfurtransferase GlpE [Coxiella endosymbiont of Ornithodoros amblus]|uniref:thiosulfate sulfurtransferase GlpE n=1 Tax=Coxiella endosymbiont of Ornithodoros amblus TaxID=1656166 RepID=UPI00244E2399|nr:thiosulfate sulfurtransferase GlpE [Coxiella endosymbiont of Ornithodoros amblus]MBW5802402.1 thiosulfate sulfurtransferase GlpE [Coxiella endosymbiont of Ornithodoros amblus]
MMYKQISHVEAWELVKKRDIVIADVRDQDSHEEEHIANALHLSMAKLQEYFEKADKEKPILVYCYHGISSQSVAQHLIKQGFKEVYSLIGGFETWKAYYPTSGANKN